MKQSSNISLNVLYLKNEISMKDSIYTDDLGDQKDSLKIKPSSALEHNVVFDESLGIRLENDKKQNILTAILNTDTADDLIALFKTYGFMIPYPSDNLWYDYDTDDLLSSVFTLKHIILLRKELGSKEPDYDQILASYKYLITNGKIKILGFLNGTAMEDAYSINIEKNTWSKNIFEYNENTIDILMHQLHQHEDVDKDGNICYLEKFNDPVLDKMINITIPTESDTSYKYANNESMLSYLYNIVPCIEACNNNPDINAICLYKYVCANNKGTPAALISSDQFDDAAKHKLISFAGHLCNAYINDLNIQLTVKLSDSGKSYSTISDILSGIVLSLAQINFKLHTFAKCAKPGCNNYFLQSVNRNPNKNYYCCTKHAKSEAQKKYRKKPSTLK
ncbi:hypothetical protein [Butyrivibrio sp. AE3004]|uniref:hypothetical protein n=1 Tax=Butyrivibrio sp. AE3004 TaxID=1506994 RepID=UPI000494569E|nr:hypothetical protein [Butyrivibrio sp. AE3004]